MKKGRVRITNEVISNALGFPVGWVIEGIKLSSRPGESIMIVSGNEFPETTELGEIKDVEVIIHQEARRFEVKENLIEPVGQKNNKQVQADTKDKCEFCDEYRVAYEYSFCPNCAKPLS